MKFKPCKLRSVSDPFAPSVYSSDSGTKGMIYRASSIGLEHMGKSENESIEAASKEIGRQFKSLINTEDVETLNNLQLLV